MRGGWLAAPTSKAGVVACGKAFDGWRASPSRVVASAACWGSSGLGAPASAEGTSLEDMRAAGSPGARRGTAPAPENQEGYASRLGSHVGIACNACKSSTHQANPIFHWGTLGPGLRGLPKLAYLSASSISAAAAAAISLLLCNLCEM